LAAVAIGGGLLFAAPASAKPDQDHKVTICHFTASETNPYVVITIDQHALKHHFSNHNGVTSPHQGQDGIFLGYDDDGNILCNFGEEE
jgi:hypothetical protein